MTGPFGNTISSPHTQTMIRPSSYFVQVPVDTIHRRVSEFQGRIARRFAAFSAISIGASFLGALVTAQFEPFWVLSGDSWRAIFCILCGLSFLCALVFGGFCIYEWSKTSADYVVAQITGKVDVETYPVHHIELI